MEITQERLDELEENYHEAHLAKTELRMLIDVYRKAVNPHSETAERKAVRMTIKGFELMKGDDGFWLHFGNCALNAHTLFPAGQIGREQFGKWLDNQEPMNESLIIR